MRPSLVFFVFSLSLQLAAQPGRDVFDTSRVTDVRLDFAPGQFELLQQDYLLDTYYEATFSWEGNTVTRIGVRSRGNGSRIAAKPGLKLDFNQFVSGQTFLGFKSLVLDNLAQDRSMMAEFLSLQLFEKMGIPAPRAAFVRLLVNGVNAGLYTLVEPVDKLFLQRTRGEDSGFLYDYEWNSEYWFHYAGPDPALYSPLPFTPKTNEKSPDPAPLVDFIRTLNEAPDEDLPAALAPFVDPRQFLDYLATETYLAERDGMTGDWGINNFYLYRPKGQSRHFFIPWDKDGTFGSPDQSVWNRTDRNVLTRRLLANPEYRDYFHRAVEKCASIAGNSGGWLNQEIDRTAALIRPFAESDTRKQYPTSEFEDGVAHLREFVATRASFVRAEIAPTP